MAAATVMSIGSRALSATMDFIIDGSDIMVYMKRHEAEILERRESARNKATKARVADEPSQQLLADIERKKQARIQREYQKILADLEKARQEQDSFAFAQISCSNSSRATTYHDPSGITLVSDNASTLSTPQTVSSVSAAWTFLFAAISLMLLLSLGTSLYHYRAGKRHLVYTERQLRNAEQVIDRQKIMNDSKQSKLDKVEKMNRDLLTQIASEKSQNEQLTRAYDKLAADKQPLELDEKSQVEIEELRSQITSEKSENEKNKRAYDKIASEKQLELDKSKVKIQELHTQLASEVSQNEERRRAFDKIVAGKQSELDKSKVNIQELRGQIASEKSQNEECKRGYDKIASEKQLLEENLALVTESLDHSRKQLRDAEQDCAAIRTDGDSKQRKIDELKMNDMQVHKQVASMKRQTLKDGLAFDKIANENQELKGTLAQVNQSHNNIQSALDSTNDELRREKQIHDNMRSEAYKSVQQLVEVNLQDRRKYKVITRLLLRRNASLQNHGGDSDDKADGSDHNEPSDSPSTPEKQASQAGDHAEDVNDLPDVEDQQENDTNENTSQTTENGRKRRRRQRGGRGKKGKNKQIVAENEKENLDSITDGEQRTGPPANAPTGPRSMQPNVYKGPPNYLGRMPEVQTNSRPYNYAPIANDPVTTSAIDSMADWQLRDITPGAVPYQSAPNPPQQGGLQASCWATNNSPALQPNEFPASREADSNSPVPQQNGLQASVWATDNSPVLQQDGSQASQVADSNSPVLKHEGLQESRWANSNGPVLQQARKKGPKKPMNGSASAFTPGKRY